ncbi:MAG: hypothetical protein CMJ74_06215 [Planctomycetaceae bacterium]|nr:hypothetical protein [Planctomycetaceae bacterium]
MLLCIATSSGCTMLATGLWIIDPNDRAALYGGLKKNRVAVVCRPHSALALQHFGADRDLAAAVTRKLSANVRDIDCVGADEILDWRDANQLNSLAEFGKAMQADTVVVIDLDDFKLYQGKSMLQGTASADVTVFNVAKDQEVFVAEPLEVVYPPENGVPFDLANQKSSENRFRKKFINVLADQISRNFYAYDSREAVKIDRFYTE